MHNALKTQIRGLLGDLLTHSKMQASDTGWLEKSLIYKYLETRRKIVSLFYRKAYPTPTGVLRIIIDPRIYQIHVTFIFSWDWFCPDGKCTVLQDIGD